MKKCILSLVMVTFLLLSCNQQVKKKEVENTAETSKNHDPLPSWNDTKSKQDIIAFVNAITDSTHANYVKPEDRIITFDNDGTL